jgi:hypothetical protein
MLYCLRYFVYALLLGGILYMLYCLAVFCVCFIAWRFSLHASSAGLVYGVESEMWNLIFR